MRLTHLTLKNWRNFKHADFDLQDRMFVIGPNASGKSNLLDALRFLKQIASTGGGFQDAVERRGGMPRIRCLAARNFNHGHVTLGIKIGDDDQPCRWSYKVTFTAESRGRHRPILKTEVVKKQDEIVLERPTPEDGADPERMTQTYLEQVNVNREFREIVEFLGSIRYLHLVPHLIREPERGAHRLDDPYGADFLLRIAKTPEKTRSRRLGRINQALKVAVPQLDRLELVQDEIGGWHLEARYQHLEAATRSTERARVLGRHAPTGRSVVGFTGREQIRRAGAARGARTVAPPVGREATPRDIQPCSTSRRPAGIAHYPLRGGAAGPRSREGRGRDPSSRRRRHGSRDGGLTPGHPAASGHRVESG